MDRKLKGHIWIKDLNSTYGDRGFQTEVFNLNCLVFFTIITSDCQLTTFVPQQSLCDLVMKKFMKRIWSWERYVCGSGQGMPLLMAYLAIYCEINLRSFISENIFFEYLTNTSYWKTLSLYYRILKICDKKNGILFKKSWR